MRMVSFLALLFLAAPLARAAENPAAPGKPRLVRIGHYQCSIAQSDFEANLAKHLKGLDEAADAGLDIVSFPECGLTGYYATEADSRANAFTLESAQMKRVQAATAKYDMTILVGFHELRGEKLFNTVAVLEHGKMLGHYSKTMVIHKFHEPGMEFPVFEKKGLKFGVLICADGGFIEPARILALKGARLIFCPHYNFITDPIEHYQMVRNDHVSRAVENGIYFLRGDNVEPADKRSIKGLKEDVPAFGYGDSYLVDPMGQIVAGAGLYHEHLMIYQLDLDQMYRSKFNTRNIRSMNLLRDQVEEAWKPHQERMNRTAGQGNKDDKNPKAKGSRP